MNRQFYMFVPGYVLLSLLYSSKMKFRHWGVRQRTPWIRPRRLSTASALLKAFAKYPGVFISYAEIW